MNNKIEEIDILLIILTIILIGVILGGCTFTLHRYNILSDESKIHQSEKNEVICPDSVEVEEWIPLN